MKLELVTENPLEIGNVKVNGKMPVCPLLSSPHDLIRTSLALKNHPEGIGRAAHILIDIFFSGKEKKLTNSKALI